MSIWVMTSRGLVGVFGVGLCPLAVWLAACGSADDRSRYGSGGSGGTTAGMSGGSANAGGSNVICKPSPIDDWTPTWTPPLAPTPGVCTAAQIDALTNACVAPDTSTLVSCRAFNADQNNAACLSCVLTPATSPAYGAASQDSYGFLSANEGGCIAEADGDLSADGCGAKNQAYNECLLAACEKNCWTGKTPARSRPARMRRPRASARPTTRLPHAGGRSNTRAARFISISRARSAPWRICSVVRGPSSALAARARIRMPAAPPTEHE